MGIGLQPRRFLGNEVTIRSGLGWMHAQRLYLSQSTSLMKAVIPSSPTPHLHTLYKRAKLIHNHQTSGVPVNQNKIQYVSVGLSGQGDQRSRSEAHFPIQPEGFKHRRCALIAHPHISIIFTTVVEEDHAQTGRRNGRLIRNRTPICSTNMSYRIVDDCIRHSQAVSRNAEYSSFTCFSR